MVSSLGGWSCLIKSGSVAVELAVRVQSARRVRHLAISNCLELSGLPCAWTHYYDGCISKWKCGW